MNTKARHKFLIHLFIALIIVVVLVVSFLWHEDKKNYNSEANQYATQIQQDKRNTKKYTRANVINSYDKTEPNIINAEKSSARRTNQALRLAYNHCQTQRSFNRNQNHIKQLLGNNFGSAVDNDVRPQYTSKYYGKQSWSKHLTMLKIGFGEFNTLSKTIPVNVVVGYRTPAFNKNGAGYSKSSENYFSVYQLSYQPKNSLATQFTVNHRDKGANRWNSVFK